MADSKTPIVQGDTDISGKKNRKAKLSKGHVAWRKLGEGIDPAFNHPYFLFVLKGSGDIKEEDYKVGYLNEIKEKENSTTFFWDVDGFDDPQSHFTHCAPCAPPID